MTETNTKRTTPPLWTALLDQLARKVGLDEESRRRKLSDRNTHKLLVRATSLGFAVDSFSNPRALRHKHVRDLSLRVYLADEKTLQYRVEIKRDDRELDLSAREFLTIRKWAELDYALKREPPW